MSIIQGKNIVPIGIGGGSDIIQASILAKILEYDGKNTLVTWTMGIASDWEGAWDEYYFSNSKDFRKKFKKWELDD